MKLTALFLAFTGLCSTANIGLPIADDQMIEYKLQDDRYAIVVSLEEGATMDQAKQAALQRAAQITVNAGNRYFVIQSEKETEVMKSNPAPMPSGNLYQEKIVEGDKTLPKKSNANARTVPALRVVFKSFEKKPVGKAYDACDYTDCNKRVSKK